MKTNRILAVILLMISLSMVSCKSTQPIEINTQEDRDNVLESFAQDVFKFVIQDKSSVLDRHLPTINVVREMYMSEVEGKSDEEIEVLILQLKERLIENAEKVRKGIKESGHNLKLTEYAGYIPYPDQANGSVEVMSIQLKNGSKEGAIPITFDLEDGIVYFLEILMTTNVIKGN
ncbi:MAG: hypothetical protein KDD32_05785 [Bacteroidetes bacterium]|nr:hypothetical protein [Bacteroidota bacterium]